MRDCLTNTSIQHMDRATHCSTSLHPETCLFTNCNSYSSRYHKSFSTTTQVLICSNGCNFHSLTKLVAQNCFCYSDYNSFYSQTSFTAYISEYEYGLPVCNFTTGFIKALTLAAFYNRTFCSHRHSRSIHSRTLFQHKAFLLLVMIL